ncbi:type I-E CRISPR-associated protein Cas6/Cse3/CasE [Arenimonas composti]|uniref:CRISPR-associated protein Cse3 n=1 Tax=Arenimonas composti TR7-09 = DSM 18010 TaxID=1121013 RepID=A0A091BY50_9GAMM|nr:type I-E CRISPR-associated protein Cas6/Cse3/CasE [Arenimonas composti]KFN49275.1 hypothetical protein P873_11555 [Arenimonas composti TR7-09 = DSM 18010]
MSWFSRVTMTASTREDRRRLRRLHSDPYQQHQVLWTLFARPPGSRQPFLFRQLLDDDETLRFLLVSEDRPAAGEPGWRVESKPYSPRCAEGTSYTFNIRVNPTRSEKSGDGRGKRQDYVISRLHQLGVTHDERAAARRRIIHEELPSWLARRAAGSGFELGQCTVDRHDVLRVRKDVHDVTLGVAEFSGVLKVSDPERFAKVLVEGLGHGRGFGLGLLLVRPTASTDT